jgi:hypothetical protein
MIGASIIVEILKRGAGEILKSASPHIRKMAEELVTKLGEAAAETPNTWDDKLVALLADLLDVGEE